MKVFNLFRTLGITRTYEAIDIPNNFIQIYGLGGRRIDSKLF